MVINIAVCDNDQIIHALLKEYFSHYKPCENISYEVSYFSNGFELLDSYSVGNFYHLVVLDIEMPGINGIAVAQKIQETYDFNVPLVFLTNYPENMHKNFSIQPCQYWIKPLSFNDFNKSMSFLSSKIESACQSIMLTCISGETINLRLQDIIYIDKIKSDLRVILHTLNFQYIAEENSVQNPELLNDFPFVNVSEDRLINLQHIKNFHKKSVELSNDLILKLNSEKEKELRNVFFNYMMSN